MSIIIYGGARKQVEKQLTCKHKWHGPCIDHLGRYFKCTECFCLDRDFVTEKRYFDAEKEVFEEFKDRSDEIIDLEFRAANLKVFLKQVADCIIEEAEKINRK